MRGRRDRIVPRRRAGLEPITLHDARYTFASLMIAAGVNAKEPNQAQTRIVEGKAAGVGFEPTEACASTVFKTVPFGRSGTPPCRG